MGTFRAPVFENMNFPPYEYQEYPKAISIPKELEENFELISHNASNMVFCHDRDGNEICRPARNYIRQVQVNSEEEEQNILAKIKKLSALVSVAKTPTKE